MRILFVENDAVFASVVTEEFLAEHDVTLVGTIERAIQAATAPFEAVLVDYDLDDGKGTKVVEALRRMGFSGRIIGVSSHERGNSALVAAGANGTCSKMDFAEIAGHLGSTKAIFEQALALPERERAALIDALADSIVGSGTDPNPNEAT